MARRGGELVGGITAFADGPDEMRKVIREHVEIGVDNIKLSMSGEEVSAVSCTQQTSAMHSDWTQPDHRDPIGPRLLLHRRRDRCVRRRSPQTWQAFMCARQSQRFGDYVSVFHGTTPLLPY
jgi:hypothetical protein